MIKAFTISFDFDGKTYLALARIRKDNSDEMFYNILFYDSYLARILPEELSLNCTDNDRLINNHPLAGRLQSCIQESILAHLQLITFRNNQ
jgi:hypothetical protein